MIPDVSRREVSLREWYDLDVGEWTPDGHTPVAFGTVEQGRKYHRHDFPKPSKMYGRTAAYYLSELRAWKKKHPGMWQGRPVQGS